MSPAWVGRKAQVLVEAAVVFPLLLMVTIGLVQFTLYVHGQNVVIAAAEDAARVAAEQGSHASSAQQRGRDVVRAGLGASVQPTVTVAEVPPTDPDHVVVTVKADQRLILPWVPLRDPNVTLSATAQMSKERFRAQ